MNTSVVPGSVVVGVDGSAHSEVAVEWAAAHARDHQRPLTIVHAAGGLGRLKTFGDVAATRRSLRMAGRRVTDHALGIAQRVDARLDISVYMPLAEARPVLLEAAETAGLLVVGTRGRGSLASFLLGSVSSDVSAHAGCPVVVVRRAHAAAPENELAGKVVVGLDGSHTSMAALELAFDLASWQRRPLAVLHAWGIESGYLDLTRADLRQQVADDHALLVAESLAGYGEKYPDVTVTRHQVRQDPADALLAASRSASTVVVGSRGLGDAAAILLGSVSRAVVERGHCTTVVVRGGGRGWRT
jgi:nucleotide-binding universal stress UspA family protein